jgi:hypothetical protein
MVMSPRLLRPVASGFNPKRLTGLAAWYDASVLSSVTLTSGFVSQWNDLSGGGLNLTQGTEAARPGVGTLNGRQAIVFDGSNDFLANAAMPSGYQFGTIAILFTQDQNPGSTFLHGNVSASTFGFRIAYSQLGTDFRTESYNSSGTAYRASGGVRSGTDPRVLVHTFDGQTTATMRLDGTAFTGTNTFGRLDEVGLIVGAARSSGATATPMNGRVGEVVIYTRLLSAAEISRVEGYLAKKWGATLA